LNKPTLQEIQTQAIERMAELMPAQDDLILIVLRGHLLVEEQLLATVKAHARRPEAIQEARLSFRQMLHVARSVSTLQVPDAVWSAALKLNELRNALAHQLEPSALDAKISALVDPLIRLYPAVFSHFPATATGRVRSSLSVIYGNILGFWSVHAAR